MPSEQTEKKACPLCGQLFPLPYPCGRYSHTMAGHLYFQEFTAVNGMDCPCCLTHFEEWEDWDRHVQGHEDEIIVAFQAVLIGADYHAKRN